jgi:hypothetical protein
LCQGENASTARGTAPRAVESAPEHVFILAVPPHLADAAGELVSALVEAAADPRRRARDAQIAREAWRRVPRQRHLAGRAAR